MRGEDGQPVFRPKFRPSVRPRLANPSRFQSDGSADDSGSVTSTRVQPLFRAEVARCSTIPSATRRQSAAPSVALSADRKSVVEGMSVKDVVVGGVEAAERDAI